MRIIVASTNPVKLQSARDGLAAIFPNEQMTIEGVSVASGVTNQPMSDGETLRGAQQRATNARAKKPDADAWIGIEGGVEDGPHGLEVFAWVVILSVDGKIGRGRTATFFLPEKIAALVRQGTELGEADDIVFGRTNSKQQNGAVGILTGDAITRASYYAPAVTLAAIPLKNKSLF